MPETPASVGLQSHLAGSSAEDQAARVYEAQGYRVLERRWRGAGGEIDLILRKDAVVVFVEVKLAASIAAAATRITPRQMQRIQKSAALFLDRHAGGSLTDARIDVALISKQGQVEILENAYGQG